MFEYTGVGPSKLNAILGESIETGMWWDHKVFSHNEDGCLFILLYEFS